MCPMNQIHDTVFSTDGLKTDRVIFPSRSVALEKFSVLRHGGWTFIAVEVESLAVGANGESRPVLSRV